MRSELASIDVAIPSVAALGARAATLIPTFAARGAEGDKTGRIADDLIEQLAAAGMFKVTQPPEYGGYGYTGVAACITTENVARGDGSAAWVLFNLQAGCWNAGVMRSEAREEIWGADRSARVCTVNAPRGKALKVAGGYRVTGKWPFASGCLHAQWATLGALVIDDGKVVGPGMVVVPMTDLKIHVDWDVGGFRGTGSNTLILEDVFVPDHRAAELGSLIEGRTPFQGKNDLPYYRTSLSGLFAVGTFGPLIGLAEAALDAFTGALPGREVAYSMQAQAESEIIHLHVGRLRMAVNAARLLVADCHAMIDAAAAKGEPLIHAQKAKVRASLAYTARILLEDAQAIMSDAGGRGLAEAGRLPRVLRDLQALHNHGLVNSFQVLAAFGAVELGQQPKLMLA